MNTQRSISSSCDGQGGRPVPMLTSLESPTEIESQEEKKKPFQPWMAAELYAAAVVTGEGMAVVYVIGSVVLKTLH